MASFLLTKEIGVKDLNPYQMSYEVLIILIFREYLYLTITLLPIKFELN